MKKLPIDVAQLILGYLDDIDLARACAVDKNMRFRICNNDYWIRKIREKYGLGPGDFTLNPDQTYAAYYFELYDTFRLRNPTRALRFLVRLQESLLDVVKAAVYLGANIEASIFYDAAQNGHYDIIKYLLEQGYQPTTAGDRITLQQAADEASRIGRQDILDLLQSYGHRPLLANMLFN